MKKKETIPAGRFVLKVDIAGTLTAMRVGETSAFEMDDALYLRARATAAQLKRQNVGKWSTSAKLIPSKVVITRLA